MTSTFGIPTTRISDLFFRQRLLQQVQFDQRELFRIQTQLSTGRRFERPSEDPVASLRVMNVQGLLERKSQVQTNLTTNQSYLTASDAALSTIAGLINEARSAALGVADTISTDGQRAAAVQRVEAVIRQLVDTGNTEFRGRHLFAGSAAQAQPFDTLGDNGIEYRGNEEKLRSYADLGLLFETNLHGGEVFGAISEPVRGAVDLNPALTDNTRLADLRGGQGIAPGSIAISDGTNTSIVDLSRAETIGDVAALVHAHPPQGRTLEIDLTSTGLEIRLDAAPGNLAISEVGQGTTARDLGILSAPGVAGDTVVGGDLDPILRKTTRLADILGTRARATIRSTGVDNDIILKADKNGSDANGVAIRFVDDAAVTVGNEIVDYDPAAKTIVVRIDQGHTQARHVVVALNDPAAGLPFAARLDPLDEQNQGKALIPATPPGENAAVTGGGSGAQLDQASGLQIVNAAKTSTVSLATAETIDDVLNLLNSSGAGVLAEINADATGINLRSRVSGSDFAIGENGGTTASQLGLRSFTGANRLEDLNFGRGVDDAEGTDLVITRADGAELPIDVAGLVTVDDVLNAINTHAANTPVDPGGGPALVARLAAVGNGIELVDNSIGPGTLTVGRPSRSRAAIDLGLVAEDADVGTAGDPGAAATAPVASAAPDSNLIFQALHPGTYANGVQIVFQDTGVESFTFDQGAGTMTFTIDAGVTDANRIINLFNADPVAPSFYTAQLDPADGNTGLGPVDDNTSAPAVMAGGAPEVLTGADAGRLETEGIFTALVRLKSGLQNNDLPTIQRAIDMLDGTVEDVNFSRAELGARQQGLDAVQARLEDENVQLREVLSKEYDADLAEVISNLTAKQAAMEAALRSTAQIFQMTLLNYL